MLRIPKDMEGRRLDILVQGITTIEIKVSKITDDEIIGEYKDGEEAHVSQSAVRVWWIPKRKEVSDVTKAKLRKAKRARDNPSQSEKAESTEEETDTPEQKED
jgi:hypothetical protein